MSIPLLIASLVAILAVSALVRYLRLGEGGIRDAADAARIAEEQIAAFDAATVLLSETRTAALVEGRDGRIVILKCHGAHCAGRVLQRPLGARRDGLIWRIETGDALYGKVALTLAKQDADKLLTMM
ncbi:hypothetical protein [Blastomonas sp.]|uniref:hypothetical protein n=1 Tax=Blastomonas sp. TaxID=1909299 RepID=UPI0035944D3F